MTIRFLGFLETDVFAATLTLKHRSLFTAGPFDTDIIPLRTPDGETPLLEQWKSARTLLSKIRNGATRFFDGKEAQLGEAIVQRFHPQSATPWRVEEENGCARLHLAIIPSPGLWLHSGSDRTFLAVGSLAYVSHTVLHSELNVADHAAVHLIVDVKRPDAEG